MGVELQFRHEVACPWEGGKRDANAVTADNMAGCMRADACCDGERDEREAGHQRARPEDVLEIDRAEVEEPEDRSCCGEHQEEPSADCAIAEPPDLEKRSLGVRFEDGERGEPDETGESEA